MYSVSRGEGELIGATNAMLEFTPVYTDLGESKMMMISIQLKIIMVM